MAGRVGHEPQTSSKSGNGSTKRELRGASASSLPILSPTSAPSLQWPQLGQWRGPSSRDSEGAGASEAPVKSILRNVALNSVLFVFLFLGRVTCFLLLKTSVLLVA